MVNRVISSRVAVVLTVLLMLPIPGTMGVLIEGAGTAQITAGPSSRATGSRAGENVTIHGRIEDAGGTPPARAILVAADVNASQLINYTITTDGNYALEVPNETTYFFMMVPFTDTTLGGSAGEFVHDLSGIYPLHQPKTAAGAGGFAPVLFADLHVDKVIDTVSPGVTTAGDGYIGNGVGPTYTLDGDMYQEASDLIWIKRLRSQRHNLRAGP